MKVLALLLLATPAFGQVQVVSLDRIDIDAIALRPTETARVSDVCICGCQEGGVCTCPNCPSKGKTPITLVVNRNKLLPDGSPDTLAPGMEKLVTISEVGDPSPAYRAPTKPPAPTAARYTNGSCANGQCGPARGRFRLFGRRR